MTLAISGTTGITLATQFDSASTFAFKNRFINGQMQVAQRNTTGTSGAAVPTTSPATYPSIDRWYAYATGATVTVAQVAGTGAIKNNLQVSGAASVTAVGVGQRIEQLNCYDLAGSTCTLSVNMSNSLLTTVTWTASYATSANTWSAKTQIATGTFTVTGTLANYSAQITVPAAATTGIEILFTVGAQTSGTWVIGNAQFEKSSIATTFDYRPFGTELTLCQRYYEKSFGIDVVPANGASGIAFLNGFPATVVSQGNIGNMNYRFVVPKRSTAALTVYGNNTGQVAIGTSGAGLTWLPVAGYISAGVNDVGFTFYNSTTAIQVIYFHFAASSEL